MNTPEIQTYLRDLRDSGEVNMMNAGSYLQQEFGMSRGEAREAVLEWMKNPNSEGN